MRSQAWWTRFYDETMAEILLDRPDPEIVEKTLDFLVEKLALKKADSVLDQCCGRGTLSVALARRGYRIVGVDQCAPYITHARKACNAAGLFSEFHISDATVFTATPRLAAGFNWYTSFGYTLSDDLNRTMIERAGNSIEPGGRFALDFPNFPMIFRNFEPTRIYRHTVDGRETVILRESRFDLVDGAMYQTWTHVSEHDTPPKHTTCLRIYMPHQIVELMRASGFENINLFGDVTGTPIGPDSPRCIAIGQRTI